MDGAEDKILKRCSMPRKFTITVDSEIDNDEYADLANALRMFMRNTPFDFSVTPDGKTEPAVLQAAWEQYGQDARW